MTLRGDGLDCWNFFTLKQQLGGAVLLGDVLLGVIVQVAACWRGTYKFSGMLLSQMNVTIRDAKDVQMGKNTLIFRSGWFLRHSDVPANRRQHQDARAPATTTSDTKAIPGGEPRRG